MTHPTAKVVTLLLAAAGYRFAHLAPVPPPTKADKVTKGSLFERNVRTIALTTHVRYLFGIPPLDQFLQFIKSGDSTNTIVTSMYHNFIA